MNVPNDGECEDGCISCTVHIGGGRDEGRPDEQMKREVVVGKCKREQESERAWSERARERGGCSPHILIFRF